LKILDVGSGETNGPEKSWTDAEVWRMDIDDKFNPQIVHDITKPFPEEIKGMFDVVFCSHVLEHISWREVYDALKNMSEAVKEDGKLYIIVPDITWACKMVAEGKYTLGVMGVLYGAQTNEWQYHKNGFTKEALALMIREMGWRVVGWRIEQFIVIMNGVRETADQIVMIAERSKGD
jgi:predicted SAM-dependent methyltransferase